MQRYLDQATDLVEEYIEPSFSDDEPHPAVETVLGLTLDRYIDEPEEAVLSSDEITAADSLDDLEQRYREQGHTFDEREELYRQARDDWWLHNQERDSDPTETVSISYDDGDQVHQLDVTLLGFAHGQRKYMALEDDVSDFLHQQITGTAEEADVTYMEENLPRLLKLPPGTVREMQDHDLLERFPDRDGDQQRTETPPNPYIKKAGGVFNRVIKGLDHRYDTPGLDSLAASQRALEQPEAVGELQDVTASTDLPYHLELERSAERTQEFIDWLDDAIEERVDDLGDSTKDDLKELGYRTVQLELASYAEKAGETLQRIGVGRSEYMAATALQHLFDDTDEVALVVGAGHQSHIVDFYEDLDREQLEAFRDGEIDAELLDGHPVDELD
ncbi:MAG: hypothetical protein SV186_07185, partial [Candidatus Nanohaloarchaea archaeon]|nr:hypothetical protein [Candidatus Nanohaloarchaea archaeon]